MAANKTTETKNSVVDFLNAIDNPKRKQDAFAIFELMNDISKVPARMWGSSIVGYDLYKYNFKNGKPAEFFKIGFSPRKQAVTLYFMNDFQKNQELIAKLGKYKISKACLYINKIEDVDLSVLKSLIIESYEYMTAKYG